MVIILIVGVVFYRKTNDCVVRLFINNLCNFSIIMSKEQSYCGSAGGSHRGSDVRY